MKVLTGLEAVTGWKQLQGNFNMPPKRDLPQPRPAGVVGKAVPLPPPPKMPVKRSAAASSSTDWDPEQVEDVPKSKKWWTHGSRGRKKKEGCCALVTREPE